MNTCFQCGMDTTNPKFCSRSCAAKCNNKNPKRVKTKICRQDGCDELILSSRTYCATHKGTVTDYTLEDAIYKEHHKSSAYALVRSRARAVVRNETQVCEECGYDKHVEVAHIKAIGDFSLNTRLSEINSRANLRILCPNCHWEFDYTN